MSVNPTETTVVAPGMQPPPSTGAAPVYPALYQKAGGDWEKANKSYFDLVAEYQRIMPAAQSAEQLVQRNAQLESAINALSGGNGGGPPSSDNPWEQVRSELGLPIENFQKATRQEVLSAVEELFGPVIKEHQAEAALSEEIDNFDQLRAEARRHMKDAPDVAEVFNAVKVSNPAAAWKYAIQQTLLAKGGRPPQPPNVQHAGLPGGQGGGGRVTMPGGAVPQEIREKEALDYAHAYGDNAPYRHERFKGTSIERAIASTMQHFGISVPPGTTPTGW